MILPDVNVLVNAFRSDSSEHTVCRAWLDMVVNGRTHFGMSPQVLSGVVRITTHPKVFVKPSGLNDVLRFCNILIAHPHCVIVQPGKLHWNIFTHLCTEADARGNLIPDAWFAALAIESGCEWITLDRDYARFRELSWRLPSDFRG